MKADVLDYDEWVVVPQLKDCLTLICCDCGLVHRLGAKVSGKKVGLKFNRDDRITATVRRHGKVGLLSGECKSWKMVKK